MATPQSALTARMADDFGLEIIKFRYMDCLVLGGDEVLKLFQPISKRIMGCGPQDRLVYGDLIFMLRRDLKRLKPPSQKYEFEFDRRVGCPTANFPSLIEHSLISDEAFEPQLLAGLQELVDALPDDHAGWIDIFGDQVFVSRSNDFVVKLITHLRNGVQA